MKIASPRSTRRLAFVAAAVLTLMASQAQAQTARASFEFKKPKPIQIPGDLSFDTNGAAAPFFNAPSSPYLMGFEGVSQYDGAAAPLMSNDRSPGTWISLGFLNSNDALAVWAWAWACDAISVSTAAATNARRRVDLGLAIFMTGNSFNSLSDLLDQWFSRAAALLIPARKPMPPK